ncbi:MAG TPA: chemotaxis protein CheD [Bacillota bacterium]|nr:chemotaxis protein CheD [Bacillota bacterium]
MENVVKVGMADLKVAKAPQKLLTSGLGSCVGICLYDAVVKVGGMAHIMLPDSTLARGTTNLAKFADTAIPELLQRMQLMGAVRSRIVAKIAGGAQMFAFAASNEIMRVGERNVQAVVAKLQELKIPILANNTGGNYGRTIEFDTSDGQLHIRTLDKGETIS